MVFGRFFAEAGQRARTHYAVTSQRVVITSGVFTRKVTSLNLKTLTDISLTENSSGEGTITFGSTPSAWQMFGRIPGWPGIAANAVPAFDLIPNSKVVYEIIRNAQCAAK